MLFFITDNIHFIFLDYFITFQTTTDGKALKISSNTTD